MNNIEESLRKLKILDLNNLYKINEGDSVKL